jgi:hypothetical protein
MVKKIGRIEKISFPELKIQSIDAKIDTGAFGTSIHVDGLEEVNGVLSFWIGHKSNIFFYDKYKIIVVKSSFGIKQKRYSIYTKMKVGNRTFKIYVSLANRIKMKYPILIGRRFLYKFNYLVDVRKKNINSGIKKM